MVASYPLRCKLLSSKSKIPTRSYQLNGYEVASNLEVLNMQIVG